MLLLLTGYEFIPSAVRLSPLIIYPDTKVSFMHINAFTEALKSWKDGSYCDIYVGGSMLGLSSRQDGISSISYSNNTNIASTSLFASYNHDCKKWVVSEVDMIINQFYLLDYNASVDAFKHEIGHMQFLEHNNITGTLMNSSIIVNTNGVTIPMSKWEIHPDDKYGAYLSYTSSQYCKSLIGMTGPL
jgi:hypothetical protein